MKVHQLRYFVRRCVSVRLDSSDGWASGMKMHQAHVSGVIWCPDVSGQIFEQLLCEFRLGSSGGAAL